MAAAEGAASASPAGDAAPRIAGCRERGRSRRRTAEPSRPVVLGAATVRLHRAQRLEVRALVQPGSLSASVRCYRGDASRETAGRAFRARAVRGNGTLARHPCESQRHRVATATRSEVCGKVRFDDQERWPHYVPVRLPGTLCVEERLPAGAAGVLLSRYHASPDLILPIDAHEKTMFDAIDGRRSIAKIVDHAGGDRLLPRARALFEKLLWYDQVVFDSSQSR